MISIETTGLGGHISKYHRDLMLARYDITCSKEEARNIKLGPLRGQLPATRLKYQKAVEASGCMEFIEFSISQIASIFGLNGTNLGRQLRTHYPEILEFREKERQRLGIDDHLPRGTRSFCKKQYAEALKLLQGETYLTVEEVAKMCNVSYTGLEQHLLFYHKNLVQKRIQIREKAVRQQRKGEITGRGTVYAPSATMQERYAEAVHLFRTTPMSAAQIARQTNVKKNGFYEYLRRWHQDLICKRKNIPYTEGESVDWSKVRKYNPSTKAKYAEAINKLKNSKLSTAKVAAEFGLHPECFRGYLKEHEPELYARQGQEAISRSCTEKYREAMNLYATTTEPMNAIARRFGVNNCSLRQFIQRNFPELIEQRKRLEAEKNTK